MANGNNLNPQLQVLHERLSALLKEVEQKLSGLNDTQCNWSPDKNTWSLCQCLEHTNVIADLLLPKIEEAIKTLESQGAKSEGPFQYSMMERIFIRMISPNPPLKMPVPPIYEPQIESKPIGEVLRKYLALHAQLLNCIEKSNGLDLKKVKIASPVSDKMRLTLGAWLAGSIGHLEYHWFQAKELLANPNFPS